MEFNRDTTSLTFAALVTIVLGTLGIAAEQTIQTIIYLVLAAPSFVLSIYSTFFKDRILGGVLVFPQPFDKRGVVGNIVQIKGSIMNMGDMPTLVEIFPYDSVLPEKTKIWVHKDVPGQSDTKPLMESRFVLHPGDIYFLEFSVTKEHHPNELEIPYSFIDQKGKRIMTSQFVEIDI